MPIDIVPPEAPVAKRTVSGGFKTSEGTLYVSKPFRSKTSKKLRALITFAPRKSHFDTSNESSGTNEFRGFFALFWISIFLFTVGTYVRSLETNGYALNFGFAFMFSEDALTLAISDAVLILTTGTCVPFAKAVSKGWIRYHYTGMILQHVLQTTVLFTAIVWTFNRKWPWVQSGFLTLHSLVMIMKMHSYVTVNGNLQITFELAERLHKHIVKTAESLHGGWDKALQDAQSHSQNIGSRSSLSDSPLDMTPEISSDVALDGTRRSFVDAETANVLRQRLAIVADAADAATNGHSKSFNGDKDDHHKPHDDPIATLIHHPDTSLSDLAKDYIELQSDLQSTGPAHVQYPSNITLKNFAVYQLVPTLVYQLEYPRTDRIRPFYVFEKTVATFGTFALLYTVTESFILPLTPTKDQSFFRSLLDLALPFMIAYLLLFFIIFECICNGFAELAYFADRQFYEDWWNSTSWDEFSRKWNKPVHTFLLQHVYASTISYWKVSRFTGMFLTFLLSACAHELVMVVVTKKIRMYLFFMQLIQLPLIALSKLPAIKQNKTLGNVVFWIGLYAGFPLLCVAYVAY